MRAEIFSCFSSSFFGPLFLWEAKNFWGSNSPAHHTVLCERPFAISVEDYGMDALRAELLYFSPLFGPLFAHSEESPFHLATFKKNNLPFVPDLSTGQLFYTNAHRQ